MQGHMKIRRDLRKGDEHKVAFMQSRVRDAEPVLVDDLIRVDQQIQIEGRGSPPLLFAPIAPEVLFDTEEGLEQRTR